MGHKAGKKRGYLENRAEGGSPFLKTELGEDSQMKKKGVRIPSQGAIYLE